MGTIGPIPANLPNVYTHPRIQTRLPWIQHSIACTHINTVPPSDRTTTHDMTDPPPKEPCMVTGYDAAQSALAVPRHKVPDPPLSDSLQTRVTTPTYPNEVADKFVDRRGTQDPASHTKPGARPLIVPSETTYQPTYYGPKPRPTTPTYIPCSFPH